MYRAGGPAPGFLAAEPRKRDRAENVFGFGSTKSNRSERPDLYALPEMDFSQYHSYLRAG
jgi:hypothetical protein